MLIGKDTRISGYMLESALQAGLIRGGGGCLSGRADAHPRGGLPHPGAAPAGRHRHLRIAQSVRRQRHQVLLGRWQQVAGCGRACYRSTARSAASRPCLRRNWARRAHRRCRRALHRVLQEHVPQRSRPARTQDWWWIVPTARHTTSRRTCFTNWARTLFPSACSRTGSISTDDCGATHPQALAKAVRAHHARSGRGVRWRW